MSADAKPAIPTRALMGMTFSDGNAVTITEFSVMSMAAIVDEVRSYVERGVRQGPDRSLQNALWNAAMKLRVHADEGEAALECGVISLLHERILKPEALKGLGSAIDEKTCLLYAKERTTKSREGKIGGPIFFELIKSPANKGALLAFHTRSG